MSSRASETLQSLRARRGLIPRCACAAQHYCETDVQCRDDDLVRCSADGHRHVVTREICGHGCNTYRSACNVCETDSLFCDSDGTTLIQCDTDGLPAQFQGQPLATDCDYGCNAQRAQCNNCSPLGQPSCDGPYRIICSPDGIVAKSDLCLHGCNAHRAQCNECTPGTQQCDANGVDLVTCTPEDCFNELVAQ